MTTDHAHEPHAAAPHWTVRDCTWGGMAWSVSFTAPTKLELGSRIYSRAEVDAIVAAERERLRRLVEAVRDANLGAGNGDTVRLLTPGQERAWVALMAGLNARVQPLP